MTDNTPKISFIPKSSLVHEESFLERKRPKGIAEVLAVLVFVLSVGSYVFLYFYGNVLKEKNKKITNEIKDAQSIFSLSPDINEAKEFRYRVEIAEELLNARIAVLPVIDFIAQNTVQSILYEKFSFKHDGNKFTLSLTGEAPSYASLAYQAEVLSGKSKELHGFSIDNVVLTRFGTITFTIKADFVHEYLSYLNTKDRETTGAILSAQKLVISIGAPTVSSTTTTPLLPKLVYSVSTTTVVAPSSKVTLLPTLEVLPQTPTHVARPNTYSSIKSFWLRFKFW